jgi:hypothetical protein
MIIVKILKRAQSFEGVRYNTNKVELDQGELMVVRNFDALQAVGTVRPSDYVNYLKAVTARNHLVKSPQFHAVISCREREKSKEELTQLAEQWLDQMGYGKNPYLLIFHKDTKNNHIHIVSSRVNKQGRLVDFGLTYLKATAHLNKLTGYNEAYKAEADLDRTMSYQFSSRSQFELILRGWGYSCIVKNGQYLIYKYGRELTRIDLAIVDRQIALFENKPERQLALSLIITAHKNYFDPQVYKKRSYNHMPSKSRGFTSKLADELHQRLDIEFFFHAKPGLLPSDYTLIDHSSATVFDGADIMHFGELVRTVQHSSTQEAFFLANEPAQPEELAGWPGMSIDITDDVDDEAVHGRNRHGKLKFRTVSQRK